MAVAGSVVVELLAKTGSFNTDIDRSTKAAEKRMREFEKAAVSVGKGVGLAFVAAGAAAIAFGKDVIDGIDALNDVADATGESIENISALEDIALKTGGTLEDVSSVLVRLNKTLSEGDPDSTTGRALKAIGLELADLQKMSPAESFMAIAKALSQFADDGNKARLATLILGKQYAQLAPLLKDAAEAGALNAKVTTEQAQAAETFNKNIFELQTNINQLARDLSGPLVDAMNSVIKSFKDGRAAGKGFLEIGFENYKRDVRNFWGIDQPSTGGASGGFDMPEPPKQSVKDPAALEAEQKAEEERKKRDKARAEAFKKQQAEFKSYLDGLDKQLEKTQELTTVEQVLADIQKGRVTLQNSSQKDMLLSRAAEIDAAKELERVDKERLESQKKLNDSQKQFREYVDSLKASTASPFQTYMAGLEELQARLELGIIDADLYTQATKKLGDEFVASGKKAEEATDTFTEFAKQAQRNIQDALGNTLEDALSGNFDNIGKMWLQLVQKMAAQALAARLNEQLFGSGSSGESSWLQEGFKWVASYYGASNGSHATGLDYVPFDGYKATLHKGERVMTAADNRQFDGTGVKSGDTFDFSNATYNVGSNVSLPDVAAMVKAGNQQLEAKIIRNRRQTA